MTQTCVSTRKPTSVRRRSKAPLPVLISIPKINTGSPSQRPRTRVRRRRLRREVRIVGYVLLIIFPLSMAYFTLAGEKVSSASPSPTLLVEHRATAGEASVSARQAAVISLAPLEPVVTVQRELSAPVILPGYLLPADAPEESRDGGH